MTTLWRSTLAAEILALYPPVVIAIVKPYLVTSFDGAAGEEGYAWKAEVLVHGEHLHGQKIGLAQMVKEAADVSKESGINTVYIPNLVFQGKEE